MAETGAGFQVLRAGGGVALPGRVGPDLGRWSAAFPHVYALDLTRLRAPGRYMVAASGPSAGSLDGSPPILAGAVVEGPNTFAATGVVDHMRACPAAGGDPFAPFDSNAIFKDNVQSYSTVEPAIDVTATSPLAFAGG